MLGQFISPDTIVPDETNVFDYNRYMYGRGNPMRYNDPSGHYSDQALMTHFGCETWACVEANFQGDGAYASFQGWLDILMAAEDGDLVNIQIGIGDTVVHWTGTFSTQNGRIIVNTPEFKTWGGFYGGYKYDNSWNELDFARMALMGNFESNHSAAYWIYKDQGEVSQYDARDLDCRHTDCVGRALNATSMAVSVVGAGGAIATAGACVAVAGLLGGAIDAFGVYRTIQDMKRGDATATDLISDSLENDGFVDSLMYVKW